MNKKNDIEFHEKMKQASVYAYRDAGVLLPSGYIPVESYENKNNGFYAVVLKNGDDVVVAFRGTDFGKKGFLKDAENDLQIAVAQRFPNQIVDAIKVIDFMRGNYPYANITLTGHSLGGSLAQIVAGIRDLPAVTFNAYGTKDLFIDPENLKTDKIVNYLNIKDIVTMLNAENHLGDCFIVQEKLLAPDSLRGYHEAQMMTSLKARKAISIDKLEDLKKESVKIVAVEKALNKLRGSKQKSEQKSSCPGSYPVRSYTRSDGTEVSGYIRSCGFHKDSESRKYSINEILRKLYQNKSFSQMKDWEIDQMLDDLI